jgi:hypothetical protein
MTIEINTYTVEELANWLNNRPSGSSFVDVRELSELIEQGVIAGYDSNIPYFLTNTNVALFEKKFSALNKNSQVKKQLRLICRSDTDTIYVSSSSLVDLEGEVSLLLNMLSKILVL